MAALVSEGSETVNGAYGRAAVRLTRLLGFRIRVSKDAPPPKGIKSKLLRFFNTFLIVALELC